MQQTLTSITLVLLCAVDWYRADGSLLNHGAFVYTEEEAIAIAETQLPQFPGYTYQVRCEDK